MKKDRIYISGPISGVTRNEALTRFNRAENALRLSFPNAKIVNPMAKPLPHSMPWHYHMLWDLFLLSRCSHIYMLSGWQRSDGSRIEYRWARKMGIKLLFGIRDNR